MVKLIRYALATVCFVVSVGCFALWGRSGTDLLPKNESVGWK